MTAETFLSLAERVEGASGPDRELDVAIWRAVDPAAIPEKIPLPWLHCYTTSLDAALTLVPEMHKWSVFGGGYASVEPWDGSEADEECGTAHIKAATPALALTAAALRAIAADTRGNIDGSEA